MLWFIKVIDIRGQLDQLIPIVELQTYVDARLATLAITDELTAA